MTHLDVSIAISGIVSQEVDRTVDWDCPEMERLFNSQQGRNPSGDYQRLAASPKIRYFARIEESLPP